MVSLGLNGFFNKFGVDGFLRRCCLLFVVCRLLFIVRLRRLSFVFVIRFHLFLLLSLLLSLSLSLTLSLMLSLPLYLM